MYSHVCNRQTNDIKGNVQRLWFSTENQLKRSSIMFHEIQWNGFIYRIKNSKYVFHGILWYSAEQSVEHKINVLINLFIL